MIDKYFSEYLLPFPYIPKYSKVRHSQGVISCCVCGATHTTLLKHGDDYICKACKQKLDGSEGEE